MIVFEFELIFLIDIPNFDIYKMNDNFNSIRLGNIAFNKDEYADAIRCYTAASNTSIKQLKSDAFLNRALAHKKLGLTQHARYDFSEAVNSPYKNILIDSVKKKVLPSEDYDDDDQTDDDSDNNSNYGNLFQQFHSNNSYIHSHYNYNNHKKIKNTSKIQLGSDEPLENCFSNSGFFLECSRIQDLKEHNTYHYTSTYKRRHEINRINDYINAMQEAQNGIVLGPESPNFWLIKSKASFTLRQLETALECVHFFEQQKHQNISKSEISETNASTIATINSLKKLYAENAPKVNPGQEYYTPNEQNWEINNSRIFRISLNLTHGRISEVLYDDPTHPLVLFATRELPIHLASIILNRSPYLYYLLNAIRRTLYFTGRKLYKILKPDLGIDPSVQQRWYRTVKGVPRLILQLFPQITGTSKYADGDEFPSDDSDIEENEIEDEPKQSERNKALIPQNFATKLMEQALNIGSQIGPERSSPRDSVLAGLAALEISQLIRSWIHRNDKTDQSDDDSIVFPSFDLILAIVASWLRFSYPIFPIFPTKGMPNSSRDFSIVCSGTPHNQAQFDTYGPRFVRKIIESLVSNSSVANSISLFGGVGIDEKKPDTILAFTKTQVSVVLSPSKARVYIKPQHFGTYNFGILIGEDDEMRDRNYDSLGRFWESIIRTESDNLNEEKKTENLEEIAKLNTSKAQVSLELIFKFWFNWTLIQPLLSFSTAAGQIVFAALLHAFFGVAIVDGMLADSDLLLEALLVNNFNDFMKLMMEKLKVKYVGNDFESVIETLPDMQYRAAILLDVPVGEEEEEEQENETESGK